MTPANFPQTSLDFSEYIRDRTARFSGRTWVFERIDQWLANSQTRYLLLTGEPGSGKTAIAARLAQFSQGSVDPPVHTRELKPAFLAAFHFCAATTAMWVDPTSFTRSVSLQLAGQYPEFKNALVESGDRSVNIQVTQTFHQGQHVTGVSLELSFGSLNPQAAFNAAVVTPLAALYRSGFSRPVTILVDALDEALAFKGEVGILHLLRSIDELPQQVRFLLTSRRHNKIESEFLKADSIFISGQEFNQSNEQDIREFVKTSVMGSPHQGDVEEISAKAERNFQYAKFLLKQLESDPTLQIAGLPPGLDPLYSASLRRTIGEKPWEDDFAPIMGLLSVARENLSEWQLQAYSGLQQRILAARLSDLRPFIEEGGRPPGYRLYHQSVIDFLRLAVLPSAKANLQNDFFLPASEWHEQIAAYYVPNGPSSWLQWDTYGLRHTAGHLASATLEEGGVKRHTLVEQLLTLLTDPNYRLQHETALDDPPAFHRDLLAALRCAANDTHPRAVVSLTRAALELTKYREQELRPEALFQLASSGQIDRAVRRLELFELDEEWPTAAVLSVVWTGAASDRDAGKNAVARLRPISGPQGFLSDFVNAALAESQPPVSPRPLGPPRQERDVAAIVSWFGGKDNDPELVGSRASLMRSGDVGYFAQEDAPVLVEYAAAFPAGGDRYLREYIRLHSAYQYIQYRNRSLWIVLGEVLRHPDPAWVRDMVREVVGTALAGGTPNFSEALPLAVLGLQASSGMASARQELALLRDQAIDAATAGTGGLGVNMNLVRGLVDDPATPTAGDDSWGVHRRRFAAHAQILAVMDGDRATASALVRRAASLKRGFAGFHTPANILLAETALICDPADRAATDELTNSALTTAHNIQDESFCLRMTSRCNAMLQRWWNAPVDQESSVRMLSADPRAPELTALHNVGERFIHRAPGGLPISLPVQQAASLEAIASIYHRPLADVERVNPHVDPRQPLAAGTRVNVPDPGFATWIAGRLSAGLLADAALPAAKRLELIQLLVPVASPNPTILDTVLARMLLAARPSDSQILQEVAILAGRAQPNGTGSHDSKLPA